MDTPLISIITPVGPRHHRHVAVARASLRWQTIPAAWWEHLVVYDTAGQGPAVCRNAALEQARGAFVVFLDADDYLIPTALETYLRGFARTRAAYVYADNFVITPDGGHHYSSSQEYSQVKQGTYNQHVVTAMVPTALARSVGGFDTGVDIWEDWTIWLRLAIKGWCGQRLPQPALVYRRGEGERMDRGLALGSQAMAAVTQRYTNSKGQIVMCGCNQPGAALSAQQQARGAVAILGGPAMSESGLTRLEYTGPSTGGFFLTSQATGRQYKLGGRRLVDALPADVQWLISHGCVLVAQAEFAPPPDGADGVLGSDAPPALGVPTVVITDDLPYEESAAADQLAQAAQAAPNDGNDSAQAVTDVPTLVDIPAAPAPDEATFTPKRMRKRGDEAAA